MRYIAAVTFFAGINDRVVATLVRDAVRAAPVAADDVSVIARLSRFANPVSAERCALKIGAAVVLNWIFASRYEREHQASESDIPHRFIIGQRSRSVVSR